MMDKVPSDPECLHCLFQSEDMLRPVATKADLLDHTLSAALERAHISQSFEMYLDILQGFYADDVEYFLDES
jgi:hypothetical protein